MGDQPKDQPEGQAAKPSVEPLKEAKPSVEPLKEAQPSVELAGAEAAPVNIETVFENPESSASSTEKLDKEAKLEREAPPKRPETKGALKNRSDIFSLNDTPATTPTIFSVTGVPSKRPVHRRDSSGTAFSNDEIKSSDGLPAIKQGSDETVRTQGSASSRASQFRNPVTGVGVSSNDEFKAKLSKRTDGNPVLGVGYKIDPKSLHAYNGQRIPPGGRSQGLW